MSEVGQLFIDRIVWVTITYGLRIRFSIQLEIALQREPTSTNGRLLEVHLGASQQAAVNFTFAAIAVVGG
jgi:hypothetical protein